MSAITTHVLDTTRGLPAAGVRVKLHRRLPTGDWEPHGETTTNADGRALDLLTDEASLADGWYRLTFDTGAYFESHGDRAFMPHVEVVFAAEGDARLHVPLLVSPYAYTVYRGS